MTKPRGRFITLEGIDGGGKTTQIARLLERLRSSGIDVVESAEPGGSRISQRIRQVLLDPETPELSPTTELLLYFAARAQNVDEIIRPALERGAVVVSDRFTDSTLAYQGIARGLGEDLVRQLDAIACRGLNPDLTLCLDIDLATSARRAPKRDRLENEPDEFRAKVRDAYHRLAAAEPERFRLIDASGPPDAVAELVWKEVSARVP